MPTKTRQQFVDHVRALAGRYAQVPMEGPWGKPGGLGEIEYEAEVAFQNFLGPRHDATLRLKRLIHPPERDERGLPPLFGPRTRNNVVDLLRGVANVIDGEWDIKNDALIRSRVHGEILDHAAGYLSDENVPAAFPAAIAGVALERHLVSLMINRGLERPPRAGIEDLSNALKKNAVYDNEVDKKIKWWAELRNKAVHAVGDLDRGQVREMVAGIRSFIDKDGV